MDMVSIAQIASEEIIDVGLLEFVRWERWTH